MFILKAIRQYSTLCLFLAGTVTVSSCGGAAEPVQEVVLTMQNLAGFYYGTTLTTEEAGVVTDQIQRGATIELLLYADGVTDGQLYVPAHDDGCCEIDVSLVGHWALDGNTVTLSLMNENFLNGIPLVFEETHLSGSVTLDGVIYTVVLAL